MKSVRQIKSRLRLLHTSVTVHKYPEAPTLSTTAGRSNAVAAECSKGTDADALIYYPPCGCGRVRIRRRRSIIICARYPAEIMRLMELLLKKGRGIYVFSNKQYFVVYRQRMILFRHRTRVSKNRKFPYFICYVVIDLTLIKIYFKLCQ